MPSPVLTGFQVKIVAGIADLVVSNQSSAILATYSLGSCLGISAYDPVRKAGGLLHIVLIARVKNLPPAPHLLPQLLAALSRTDTDSSRVVGLITYEPALTATVLQHCNSAYFGSATPAATVEEAVTRLGFNSIYSLVATEVAARTLMPAQKGYGLERGAIRNRRPRPRSPCPPPRRGRPRAEKDRPGPGRFRRRRPRPGRGHGEGRHR